MTNSPSSGHRKASLQIDFLIVGASVSGLTAAIGLGRAGHRVRILEKEKHIVRAGGGIRLAPNAMSSLTRWGLLPAIERVASPVRGSKFMEMESGEAFAYVQWADEVVKESGAQWYAVNWQDLVDILHRAALDAGAEIITGACVKEITAPEYEDEIQRPSATLEDGRIFDADILIGADGPYSTVRAAIEEKPTVPTWTGLLAFSGVVPMEKLTKDPILRHPDISLGTPLFCGTYRGFMSYPTRQDTSYALHLFWEYPEELPDSYDATFPGEKLPILHAPVSDLCKRVAAVQDLTNTRRWMAWPTVKTWVDESETILLMGEASCPHIPYAFHTASNPIESAACFATLFSYLRSHDQITEFVQAYETLRRRRAEEINAGDNQTAQLWTLPPGPEREKRNREMRPTLERQGATWDDVACADQWSEISHIWLYNGIDAADEWWLEWGLLRERALLSDAPEKAAAAGIRFDTLQVRVDAAEH